MESLFKPLSIHTENIGAALKTSKKLYVWKFELEGTEHTLRLECSFLTNGRRISLDDNEKYSGLKPLGKSFQHTFSCGNYAITVKNEGDDADFYVNNESFNDLYSRKIWQRIYSCRVPTYREKAMLILRENGFGNSQEDENFLDLDFEAEGEQLEHSLI